MTDVLFLTQRLPHPPDKGEKIRAHHLLHRLARRHRIHLGCFVADPADWARTETVRGVVADLKAIGLHKERARITCGLGL